MDEVWPGVEQRHEEVHRAQVEQEVVGGIPHVLVTFRRENKQKKKY